MFVIRRVVVLLVVLARAHILVLVLVVRVVALGLVRALVSCAWF